ncbi:sensor histidine kinase [Dokdonella koreensis]|uniref:histidine kinase n=1 Tax=Dokdonella koreensis DS-123 TaxID=1300342 RepID=A0A167G9W5_9GAMM|nr:ATP-binding protein [Dokdonella koreensis]ANB16316.1 Two-component system sensor protein [Dokdonella koreensis DS-123]
MRWSRLTTNAEFPLRVVLLAVAVAASLILPYLILQRSAQTTAESSAWVLHSADIKETVHELVSAVGELEAVATTRYADLSNGDVAAQYAGRRLRLVPLLDRLAEATRDNPAQQNRVGNLETLIEGRARLIDEAMRQLDQGDRTAAGTTLRQAGELFPFRSSAGEVLAAEDDLYTERSAEWQDNQRRAGWATLGMLAVQLLLIGSVIYASERQVRHRLNAESRARQAVARSRTILQNIREPILLLDNGLRVLSMNKAFREVYGVDGEEPVGVALDQVGQSAWSDAALHQRLIDVAVRDRELWDYELTQRTGEDIERIVFVNARRILLSEQESAILLTVNDVTASKRAEGQIRDLNRELAGQVEQVSEVNRELEAFSYSVSHDLRAPLRHIAGFADKLERHLGEASDPTARHYLEVIVESARRMSSLIEDLLLYSRLGRNALRMQPVDMQALAEEMRGMLMAEAGDRIIEWRIGGLPVVIGDEGMLRQVWQNLLGNAVKYTARRERALIEVGMEDTAEDGRVFYVRDNGTGFDMAYAGKLFGVFQRLHKASDFPGTGIGLANVRRILGRHGGRVWVRAAPDQGATFYFSLPAPNGSVPLPESVR